MFKSLFAPILFFSFSQNLFSQTGTLIFTVICSDGIIIVADSRGEVFENGDTKGQPLAYTDSNVKIFRIRNFGIAVAGNADFRCKYLDKIIKEYSHDFVKSNDAEFTFLQFKSFLRSVRVISYSL